MVYTKRWSYLMELQRYENGIGGDKSECEWNEVWGYDQHCSKCMILNQIGELLLATNGYKGIFIPKFHCELLEECGRKVRNIYVHIVIILSKVFRLPSSLHLIVYLWIALVLGRWETTHGCIRRFNCCSWVRESCENIQVSPKDLRQ